MLCQIVMGPPISKFQFVTCPSQKTGLHILGASKKCKKKFFLPRYLQMFKKNVDCDFLKIKTLKCEICRFLWNLTHKKVYLIGKNVSNFENR